MLQLGDGGLVSSSCVDGVLYWLSRVLKRTGGGRALGSPEVALGGRCEVDVEVKVNTEIVNLWGQSTSTSHPHQHP